MMRGHASPPSPSTDIVNQPSDGQVFPRRFALVRHVDYTGVSGVGVVAYGVRFADGHVVLRWCTEHPATSMWDSLDDLVAVHGHGDGTSVQWIDQPDDKLQHVAEAVQPHRPRRGRRARQPAENGTTTEVGRPAQDSGAVTPETSGAATPSTPSAPSASTASPGASDSAGSSHTSDYAGPSYTADSARPSSTSNSTVRPQPSGAPSPPPPPEHDAWPPWPIEPSTQPARETDVPEPPQPPATPTTSPARSGRTADDSLVPAQRSTGGGRHRRRPSTDEPRH